MIVLSDDLDPKGRPVVDLHVFPSASRMAALNEAGELSPRPIEIRALVDTGASRSVVQGSILGPLELDPVGTTYLNSASTGASPKPARLYAIQLFLAKVPGALLATGLEVAEAEDLGGLGVDMLLGRDVLDRGLLIYSGPERRFTLAFGLPPVEA